MLGLGETTEELMETLADLRSIGCDFLTLGQYLQPSTRHLPVARYLPPHEFDELGRIAGSLGFAEVASGPFVRSSYHADEMVRSQPFCRRATSRNWWIHPQANEREASCAMSGRGCWPLLVKVAVATIQSGFP